MRRPSARWPRCAATPTRTALALAVLLAAACDSPPPPTPTATPSTPTPTATATATTPLTPAPTADATPEATATPSTPDEATPAPAAAPDARSGLDLIEPAPDAFVHRTFGDGEAIEWAHGVYVFDVETGLTEGYARAGVKNNAGFPDYDIYNARGYGAHRGGWITSSDEDDEDREWRLLLDRETGRSWRWPTESSLVLEATSEEHLLFEERSGRERTSRFIVANSLMEEVARFSVGSGGAMFTPDGSAIALAAAGKVYLVPVATGRPAILFDPPPRHPEHGTPLLGTGFSSRREPPYGSWRRRDGGRGIVATASYENTEAGSSNKTDNSVKERRYFSWDGEELPAPACPGTLSPDGRYAVVSLGSPYYVWPDHLRLAEPWPSVVVTDAVTCAPILRVRSAHTYETFWFAKWLPTSDGIVVGVRGGYSIVRVRPAPGLVSLPSEWPGPVPAATGGGRYFGYDSQVYDAAEDRWHGPSYGAGPFWWGDSHRERWFHSFIYWGQGRVNWLLLPPKIEFPPFDDEIAFRVARTGSCLRLREDPGEGGRVLGCLPDGERLLLADRGEPGPDPKPDAAPYASLPDALTGITPALRPLDPWPDADPYDSWLPHPSIALLGPHTQAPGDHRAEPSQWVRIRTADGAEGWVSHDYLAHD